MTTELPLMQDDAEARRMLADWTNALLRQRSRPAKAPPRGGRWFASDTEWGPTMGSVRQRTESVN